MSSAPHEPRIRHIAEDDWDGIVALEAGHYAGLGLAEGRAALESRARASPGTCFVLELGPRLAGYLLALPYPLFRFPAPARPEDAASPSRNLHLHDLCIAQDLRRRGLGRHALRHLSAKALARGYEHISLVAVGGAETYWSARGFATHQGAVPPGSYGPNAVYMSSSLAEVG